MAAEQKARTTYENIMKLTDDPDVLEPLKFLREREVVHFQRFGEALRIVQDKLDSNDFFDMRPNRKMKYNNRKENMYKDKECNTPEKEKCCKDM